MEIVHVPGKEYRNVDGLSRFQTVSVAITVRRKISICDSVYGEVYRYLKDSFEKNKKKYHEYGFYIAPDN
jgi:hypothetical protein